MRTIIVAALVAALSGCGSLGEVRKTTTSSLDELETEAVLGRVAYQKRWGRISLRYVCTGMPWQDFRELTEITEEPTINDEFRINLEAMCDEWEARQGG